MGHSSRGAVGGLGSAGWASSSTAAHVHAVNARVLKSMIEKMRRVRQLAAAIKGQLSMVLEAADAAHPPAQAETQHVGIDAFLQVRLPAEDEIPQLFAHRLGTFGTGRHPLVGIIGAGASAIHARDTQFKSYLMG
jgi:hypothetical protein